MELRQSAHQPGSKTIMAKRKVTLWEVSAVLFIIAIVAALIFPIFAKSRGPCDRADARNLTCLSREQQLGLALLQYTESNDGFLPNIADAPGSHRTWRTALTALMPYLRTTRLSGNVFHCPDAACSTGPDDLPVGYAANYSGDYNGGHFDKGNGAFAGPGSASLSLTKFPDPHTLMLLCEVQHSNAPEFNIDDPVRFGPAKRILAPRHAGGSNYLLADGHAKWLRPLATAHLWYRDPHRPLSANADAVLRSAHG